MPVTKICPKPYRPRLVHVCPRGAWVLRWTFPWGVGVILWPVSLSIVASPRAISAADFPSSFIFSINNNRL